MPQALNGQTVPFDFRSPQPIAYSNDPGLETDLINPDGFGSDAAFATAFAGSVYELMSVYSTVPQKHTLLPNSSMDLVYEAIGGNVGFLPPTVNTLTAITSDVRDLGKSVLRGVPNFLADPDQNQADSQWQPGLWYPTPSTHTDGTDYNVFNLDPFVWFVHQKLGLSGYGFSFDDDVSDVRAGGTSTLSITYASGPAANPVESQWFPSTPWLRDRHGNHLCTPDRWEIRRDVGANDRAAGCKSILAVELTTSKMVWLEHTSRPRPPGSVFRRRPISCCESNSNSLQFVLSKGVTQTTAPIPVTFTGYVPQALKSFKRRS